MIKKEKYFNSENFYAKSNELFSYAKSYYGNKTFEFVPENSALLVLDMQDYFLSDLSHAFIPSSLAIISLLNSLISEYSARKLPVILTKNINTIENSRMMAVWWKDLITKESQFLEISKDVRKEDGIILTKSQYDAFYETNLEHILNEKQVKQIVITGVMTHLCCETTARSAFVRGFEVFSLLMELLLIMKNFILQR